MPKITLKLESESANLHTAGDIYRRPIKDNRTPVSKSIVLSKTRSVEVELRNGLYQYRFEVRDDKSKYTVKAFYEGETVPFEELELNPDQDGMLRQIFLFSVLQ